MRRAAKLRRMRHFISQKEILNRWKGLRYLYFVNMFEGAKRCGNYKGKVGAQKIGSLVKKDRKSVV